MHLHQRDSTECLKNTIKLGFKTNKKKRKGGREDSTLPFSRSFRFLFINSPREFILPLAHPHAYLRCLRRDGVPPLRRWGSPKEGLRNYWWSEVVTLVTKSFLAFTSAKSKIRRTRKAGLAGPI